MFSILVPALKERKNLEIILPVLNLLCTDIVVIDGNSNDGTDVVCKNNNVSFVLQKSRGKGNALIEGIEYCKHNVVCFFDADLSHDPANILSLVNPILNGDFRHVSGSRMLGGSSELFSDAQHFVRLFGSLVINYLISTKFKFLMTDCQNGFRALDKNLFKSLSLTSAHTTIEQELVAKTLALGIPILEIPTHEYQRHYGESKINVLKHGWSYLFNLIKYMVMSKVDINYDQYLALKAKYPFDWWIK
ncbi:glycosyltransferase family 2 protein [Candidatus Methylopumilus planktonicus]|uniref:glycosyltransferase family 2 protein n=1 Tax=Candidatus Methylopumilus planktonicus TaxID=1581557 RepID=UPI00111EED04|nr:glycosyltransferase family 2 protein [Candidatus Methylopumilus planktonicus]QDD07088.1 glycosyltransferase family 2 protein [Candidatus Methylopumilus planktonicus]QDD08424.1 glycosyltransferase family 2 protein [Candidatus Methylopumilus planktonicus]QDD09748.1 glycosyltransferase family 2 protein [Candidatus Methylopumilus planktonicus]